MTNSEDYDEDDDMPHYAQPGLHVARFLWTDILFVTLRCTANVVDEIGTGLGYLSNIAAGHANWRRDQDNKQQSRRSLENDLAALSGQED